MIDDMSMMSLAPATEPLRLANRPLGRQAFRWDLCSLSGAPVIASNGVPFSARPFGQTLEDCHVLLVCGGVRVGPQAEQPSLAALRQQSIAAAPSPRCRPPATCWRGPGCWTAIAARLFGENRTAFEEVFHRSRSRIRFARSTATG